MQQVLVEEKYKRSLKYRATVITLPDDFRTQLLLFLGKIRITAPPS